MVAPPKAAPVQRYELIERIAVGGMAEVFRAKAYGAHGFEKILAIKRILPALAQDPKFERRFIAEAKLAVALSHVNIVQVLDFSRFGSSLYIVMEYVDGGDLAGALQLARERELAIPLEVAMHVALELLRGLEFAHARGVVHRDVSPSNVLLSRAGEVKIADFGIARAAESDLSRTFKIMGKWRYMSPEQTRGDALDTRSDVFSAATVIYEVFTGQRLHPGNDPEEIVRAVRDGQPAGPSTVRADLPPEVDPPLLRALAKDPAARGTTSELLAALVAVSYARGIPTMPTGLGRFLASLPKPAGADPASATGSDRLLDEIVHSEVGGRGGGRKTRVTGIALGAPPLHPDDEVDEAEPGARPWLLEDATGSHTLFEPVDDLLEDRPTDVLDASLLARVARSATGELPAVAPPAPAPARARLATAPPPTPAGPPPPPTGPPPAELAAPLPPRRPATVTSFEPALVGLDSVRPAPGRRTGVVVAAAVFVLTFAAVFAIVHHGRSSAAGRVAALRSIDAGHVGPVAVPPIDAGHVAPVAAPPIDAGPAAVAASPIDAGHRREMHELEPVILDDTDGGPRHHDKRHDEHAAEIDDRGHAAPTMGTVDIYSEPWANVYLGSKKVGVAPQQNIRLPVGRQKLRLVNPVLNVSKTITVTVPSDHTIKVKLPPPAAH